MSAPRSVTATFTTATLTVTKSGTGNGTVTSVPAGVDCGPTAPNLPAGHRGHAHGDVDATSKFVGWSGAARGRARRGHDGRLEVVTASFTPITLTVSTENRAGTVT
jgi:hypothetical protein